MFRSLGQFVQFSQVQSNPSRHRTSFQRLQDVYCLLGCYLDAIYEHICTDVLRTLSTVNYFRKKTLPKILSRVLDTLLIGSDKIIIKNKPKIYTDIYMNIFPPNYEICYPFLSYFQQHLTILSILTPIQGLQLNKIPFINKQFRVAGKSYSKRKTQAFLENYQTFVMKFFLKYSIFTKKF